MLIRDLIIEQGKRLGYDGVCTEGCGCAWEDFPACNDICKGELGYFARNELCGADMCITPDGTCLADGSDEGCEFFEAAGK